MVGATVAVLSQQIERLSHYPWFVFAGLSAVVAGAWEWGVLQRLRWLREESVVASDALRTDAALCYQAGLHLPLAVALLGIAAAAPGLSIEARLAVPIGYALGGGLVWVALRIAEPVCLPAWTPSLMIGTPRPLASAQRRRRLASLFAAIGGVRSASFPANLAICFAAGLAISAIHALLRHAEIATDVALAMQGAILFITLVLLSRQQASLLRYLTVVGVGPWHAPAVATLLAGSLMAGMVMGALAMTRDVTGAVAILGAAGWLGFAVIATLRALHAASKSRGAANLAVQVDLVAIAILGILAFPAAIALTFIRVVMLHRRALADRWRVET